LLRFICSNKADDYVEELSQHVYSISYQERRFIASAVTSEFSVECLPRHVIVSRINIENAVKTCVNSIVGRRVTRFEESAQFCLAMIRHRGIVLTAPGSGIEEDQFANACVAWAVLAANSKLVMKLIPHWYQRKIIRIMAARHFSIREVSALARLVSEAYGRGSFPRLRHFWLYGIGT
jgi:actin-like ATPase involved in cell morphogenesis